MPSTNIAQRAKQPFRKIIRKSPSSAVRVGLDEWHEQRLVELQDVTAPTVAGLFSPTGVRVALPVKKLGELIQVLQDAEAEARALGWLPAEPKP